MKLILSILASIIVNITVLDATAIYKDCGSIVGEIIDVEVNDCQATDKTCILKRNTNATIEITFNAVKPIDTVTVVVHGKVLGIDTPFKVPNDNGCLDSNMVCPLEQGVTYKYQASLPVLKIYPNVHVEVRWELKDSDKEKITCILIPAQIKN